MSRIGWLDASSGASGDMLLGALIEAGASQDAVNRAISAVAPEPIEVTVAAVVRAGFAATRAAVEVAESTTDRRWPEIRALLLQAELDEDVRALALRIFERLARAEARVHGSSLDVVHFHEVGALDSIADIVGAAAGIVDLGLDEIHCSSVALGSGNVHTSHGVLPVPPPAVAELLRGVPTHGGPVERELTTPTGAAILASAVTHWGAQPPMVVDQIGVGAGNADPEGHPNVVRLFVGEQVSTGSTSAPEALVIEANVDDLDPRLWPEVIAALLAAGASDAWLSPILMKKGRPAHTLHVLVSTAAAPAVRREIFRQTSTIGVREQTFAKHALDREFVDVEVDGHRVAVKLARLDGEVVNAQPEYADVVAAAEATGRPVKDVLAEAHTLARDRVG